MPGKEFQVNDNEIEKALEETKAPQRRKSFPDEYLEGKTMKELFEEMICNPFCRMTNAERAALDAAIELVGYCSYDRLCELAKADADERCLVLPCAIGTPVWEIRGHRDSYEDPVKLIAAETTFRLELHVLLRLG